MNTIRSLFTDEQRSRALAVATDIRSGLCTKDQAQLVLMDEFSMGRVLSAKLMELADAAMEHGTPMRRI